MQRVQALRLFSGWLPMLEACHRRYGDVFRLHVPALGPVVVLADPDLIRSVYADPETTTGGTATTAFLRRLVHDLYETPTVGWMHGDAHLRRRRLILPALHGERLAAYEGVMTEVIDEHLAGWKAGDAVDMLEFAGELTADITVRVLFGAVDPVSRARLRTLLARMFSPWTVTAVRALLPDDVRPERVPGPWRALARRKRELQVLVRMQVQAHRARPATEIGADVCSLLLAATDEDGVRLTEQQVCDELVALSIGGSHTTVASIAWMFDYLLHDASTLARVEDAPDDEQLGKAVANEALRIRPPGDATPRPLGRDLELGELRLAAGEIVLPSIHLVHRRPDLYERPTEFLPDRFLHRQPSTYEFLPFGAGSHRCIAAAFAQLQLRTILRRVHECWRLRPARREVATPRRGALGAWVPGKGVPVAVVEARRAT